MTRFDMLLAVYRVQETMLHALVNIAKVHCDNEGLLEMSKVMKEGTAVMTSMREGIEDTQEKAND